MQTQTQTYRGEKYRSIGNFFGEFMKIDQNTLSRILHELAVELREWEENNGVGVDNLRIIRYTETGSTTHKILEIGADIAIEVTGS